MIKYNLFIICLLSRFFCLSQQYKIDSLKVDIAKTKIDSLKVKSYLRLGAYYIKQEDSANASNSFIAGIKLAKQIKKHNWAVYGLNELGYLLELTGNPKAALLEYNEAVIYARKNAVQSERAKAFSNLSFVYSDLFNTAKSIEAIDSALLIYRTIGMKNNIAGCLNNLGNKYYDLIQYDKSLFYYNEAASICQEIKNYKTMANVYLNIGNINIETKKFDIGISYLEKSKQTFESLNDKANVLLVNYNLSKAYLDKQAYTIAIDLLEKNVDAAEKIKPKKLYSNYLNLLAACYTNIKNYPKALNYYKKAIVELELQQNVDGLAVNYANYAKLLGENNMLDSALIYLKKSDNLIKNHKELQKFQPQVFGSFAYLYLKKNNHELAFEYQDSQIVYKERLINETSNNKLLDLQTKYETQQKENIILTLSQADSIKSLQILSQQAAINKNLLNLSQQQLLLAEDSILLFSQSQALLQNKLEASLKEEKISNLSKEALQKQLVFEQQEAASKRKKQLLTSLLFSTILIAGLLLLVLHQRNKKKQALAKADVQKALVNSILETEEKERTRIAKDLHDGIVQDLTVIKQQLKLINESATNDVKNQLSSVLNHVDTTSKEVREISYQMMPVTLRELGLEKALNELLNRSLSNKNISFEFDAIGIENRLAEKIETTVYRICQELLNNTIKHSQATTVSLLLQLRNNSLQVMYEDNGIGFNTASVKKGIGLNSLNSRVEMVNGKLEFDDTIQTGTAAYIKIPLA